MGTVNSQHLCLTQYRCPPGYPWSLLPILAAVFFISALPVPGQSNGTNLPASVLKKLSLNELMEIDVTSVSKHPEKWFDSPSAVQVITGEDIHRSGATRLPEALRLASNLEVAQ